MAAYVIVDVDIEDPVIYAEYRNLASESIQAYGGEFIVRGGDAETLEGDWTPGRVVVLKFQSMAQAIEWWESEEYAPAKVLRHKSAKTRMIVFK